MARSGANHLAKKAQNTRISTGFRLAVQVRPKGCSGTTLVAVWAFFNYTGGVKWFGAWGQESRLHGVSKRLLEMAGTAVGVLGAPHQQPLKRYLVVKACLCSANSESYSK
jgi:hypothetical protein